MCRPCTQRGQPIVLVENIPVVVNVAGTVAHGVGILAKHNRLVVIVVFRQKRNEGVVSNIHAGIYVHISAGSVLNAHVALGAGSVLTVHYYTFAACANPVNHCFLVLAVTALVAR